MIGTGAVGVSRAIEIAYAIHAAGKQIHHARARHSSLFPPPFPFDYKILVLLRLFVLVQHIGDIESCLNSLVRCLSRCPLTFPITYQEAGSVSIYPPCPSLSRRACRVTDGIGP